MPLETAAPTLAPFFSSKRQVADARARERAAALRAHHRHIFAWPQIDADYLRRLALALPRTWPAAGRLVRAARAVDSIST